MTGFIKYMRSEEAEFLLAYPNANHLFMVMAYRARRTDHPMNGLKAGQCFLGDYSAIGMTRQQYRTAQEQLVKWNLATFKGTNKGTIGTILNSKVYDINSEDNNQPATIGQPTSNHPTTTNKECKNGNNESKDLIVPPSGKRSKFKFSDEDMRFANEMFKRVMIINPSSKEPNFDNWANTIRLMREMDNRNHTEMWRVFRWANRDSFWCSNILSPDKFRKQYDKLTVKANETSKQPTNASGMSAAQAAIAAARQERDSAQSRSPLGFDDRAIHGQVDKEEWSGRVIDMDGGDI